MHKKVLFTIVISIILCLCGCAALQQLIDRPGLEFEGMSLNSVSLFEATPVFKFKITNPNPMGINVNKIAYNLKINNQKFIKGVSDQQVRVKAAGTGNLDLPITFNYMDVFNNASEYIKSDRVKYNLTGSINIGPFSIPYKDKGEFEIPDLPEIALKNVKISSFSLKGASLVFNLELKNKNRFPIDLNAIDYSIKLDGREFVKGVKPDISPVNKNGKSRIQIPLELSFIELGTSAYKIFKDSSADYLLSGNMKFKLPKIGVRNFPFNKSGKVRLNTH